MSDCIIADNVKMEDINEIFINNNSEKTATIENNVNNVNNAIVTPNFLYVVSDNGGLVGVFSSEEQASKQVIQKYDPIPFIIQKFPVDTSCSCEFVWVVLYINIDVVAFASNNREKANQIKTIYSRIGLTYTDDINYWKHPINLIIPFVKERLDLITSTHIAQIGTDELDRIEQAMQPNQDGPLARLIRETEKITIADCIEPYIEGIHGSEQVSEQVSEYESEQDCLRKRELENCEMSKEKRSSSQEIVEEIKID